MRHNNFEKRNHRGRIKVGDRMTRIKYITDTNIDRLTDISSPPSLAQPAPTHTHTPTTDVWELRYRPRPRCWVASSLLLLIFSSSSVISITGAEIQCPLRIYCGRPESLFCLFWFGFYPPSPITETLRNQREANPHSRDIKLTENNWKQKKKQPKSCRPAAVSSGGCAIYFHWYHSTGKKSDRIAWRPDVTLIDLKRQSIRQITVKYVLTNVNDRNDDTTILNLLLVKPTNATAKERDNCWQFERLWTDSNSYLICNKKRNNYVSGN